MKKLTLLIVCLILMSPITVFGGEKFDKKRELKLEIMYMQEHMKVLQYEFAKVKAALEGARKDLKELEDKEKPKKAKKEIKAGDKR